MDRTEQGQTWAPDRKPQEHSFSNNQESGVGPLDCPHAGAGGGTIGQAGILHIHWKARYLFSSWLWEGLSQQHSLCPAYLQTSTLLLP